MRRRWLFHLLPWVVAIVLIRAATSLRDDEARAAQPEAERAALESAPQLDPLRDVLHPPREPAAEPVHAPR